MSFDEILTKTEQLEIAFAFFSNVRFRNPPPVSNGFVYIVEFQGLYKIGKAYDVDKRIRQFSNIILPFDFTRIFAFPCRHPLLTERAVHKYHRANRVRGEWFTLSPYELLEVKYSIITFADVWSSAEWKKLEE